QADGDRVEDDFSSDLCAPLVTSVVVTSRSSNYAPALAVAKNSFEVRVELAGDAFNSCDSGAEAVACIEGVLDDTGVGVAVVATDAAPDAAIVQATKTTAVVRGVGLTNEEGARA